eukprot:6048146-Pleurochrysis_carterae.AAC.1
MRTHTSTQPIVYGVHIYHEYACAYVQTEVQHAHQTAPCALEWQQWYADPLPDRRECVQSLARTRQACVRAS